MLKKKMTRYLFVITLVFLSPFLKAQETYDISSLINRVLEENYQIRIVKNRALISDNNNTPGNAGLLPTLDAQLTRSRSNNNIRNEYFTGVVREDDNARSDNFNTYAILNWTVFDGFRMFARRDQLGMLSDLGQLETRYYIEQTVADIANAWYQLIRENRLLANYFETLGVSRYRLVLEKKKLDVGSGNALLFNQALVDYNTDSLAMMNQERIIKSLVIRINEIANLDPDMNIKPADEIINGLILQKDTLLKKAIDANIEIKQTLIEEMIAEKDIAIMRSNYYPEVNIYGQYSFNRQTNEIGTIQYGKNFGRQVGVTVRFNLFNGFNDKRMVENSKVTMENTSLQKENIRKQISSTVIDNYYQYISIAQQVVVAEQNIITAQKSLDIGKAQFQEGAISGFDFRQTQLSLIRAQNAASTLKYNLKSIEIELLRLSGDIVEKLI